MDVTDPATGELVESPEEHTRTEVEAASEETFTAFGDWRRRPLRGRARLFVRARDGLGEHNREYANSGYGHELSKAGSEEFVTRETVPLTDDLDTNAPVA